MTWINRWHEKRFPGVLQPGKVLVVYGSRQVGKTSMLKRQLPPGKEVFHGDGDDMALQDVLAPLRLSQLKQNFTGYKLIFIDEAQQVPHIGKALKLMVDHIPGLAIVVSGSSAFDLNNKLGEPLTGRQRILPLHPVSVLEIEAQSGRMDVLQRLENMLVYGTYPEVVTLPNNTERAAYLKQIRNSFLLKDIFERENIRNPNSIYDLLRLLAFQIGQEVSLNELSKKLQIAKQTVERYLDLLEKAFVIKRIGGFSRNLRKEVTKNSRYYFWDNGIRNAVINGFNNLPDRNDLGMLWENFLFAERLKSQDYLPVYANTYFWRTYDQKEVDMVEERDGYLHGYEFKWQAQKVKAPKLWQQTYPNASYQVIHPGNFLEFLLQKNPAVDE